MARKSQALRLSQAKSLHAEYVSAGVVDKSASFLEDMITQMNRGKYPTKGQRNWLDNLIESGVPQVSEEDSTKLAIVLSAVAFFNEAGNRSWEVNVLNDFANRIRKGWGFSDKQAALLQKLLTKKESEENGEHILVVTDEMQEELRILVNLYNGYSSLWRQERPGLRSAVDAVRQYLSGNGVIEQYHYDRLRKALAAKVRKFINPRFVQNSHGFYTFDNERCLILCVTDTYVTSNGSIANDWLLPSGEIKVIDQDRVSKRS